MADELHGAREAWCPGAGEQMKVAALESSAEKQLSCTRLSRAKLFGIVVISLM